MIFWTANFHVIRPLPAFVRPICVEKAMESDISYYNEGRSRTEEKHCIFVYTLAGRGRFRDPDGDYPLPPGTGFLCRVNDPSIAYYYPPDGVEPWTFLWFGFTGQPGADMVDQLVQRHGPIYSISANDKLIQQWLTFENEAEKNIEMTAYDGARMVIETLAVLGNAAHAQAIIPDQSALVRQAHSLIEKSLSQPINASMIADRLDVSREHLCRVFKEYTGTTPYEHISRQKILVACRLLKQTNLTHKEIAFRLGYDKPTNFTRAFRRIMHMTPRQFRTDGTMPLLGTVPQ